MWVCLQMLKVMFNYEKAEEDKLVLLNISKSAKWNRNLLRTEMNMVENLSMLTMKTGVAIIMKIISKSMPDKP